MSNENNTILDFTGPAGRTYFDRDGVLQTAGENEIREEYDPLTGAYLGMLIEPQERANYMPLSEDFLSYSRNHGGTEHYSKLQIDRFPRHFTLFKPTYVEDPGSSARRLGLFNYSESVNGSGEEWTLSLFVKPINTNSSEGKPLYIQLAKEGLPDGVFFNLRDLTVSGDYESAGFIDCGNGVYRIWATQTSINANTSSYTFIIFTNRTNSSFDPYPTGDEQVAFTGFQVEKGPLSTYIFTTGSHVTLPGEDARFTDPAMFNNFERGAFYVDFKYLSSGGSLLSTETQTGGFIYRNDGFEPGRVATFDGTERVDAVSSYEARKFAIYWDENNRKMSVNGGAVVRGLFDGSWGEKSLSLCKNARAYIKGLDFNSTPYTDAEARQLTKHDAATVIGDAPSGGYYDYSDLSTMLVESDESGIPVEDRKIARVGDPIGAVLDKSGHGNHLTASTDSRRGILRSNGHTFWIEKTNSSIYRFNSPVDYSLTYLSALDTSDDNFIIWNDPTTGGNWSGIHGRGSTSNDGNLSNIGESGAKFYYNGVQKPSDVSRGQAREYVEGVTLVRALIFGVNFSRVSTIFGHGGDSTWRFTGKDYGFAWASRLSEDDALIVEADMRRNMPPVT